MAKAAWKKETYVSMKQLDLVKAHLKKADEEHTVNDEMTVNVRWGPETITLASLSLVAMGTSAASQTGFPL